MNSYNAGKRNKKLGINNKVKLVIAAIIILILGLVILEKTNVTNFISTNPTPTPVSVAPATNQNIDYSPAAPNDNAEINKLKESSPPPPSPSPSPGTANISVVLNRASLNNGNAEVRGTVYGTTTGTCDAVFNLGSQTFSRIRAIGSGSMAVLCKIWPVVSY